MYGNMGMPLHTNGCTGRQVYLYQQCLVDVVVIETLFNYDKRNSELRDWHMIYLQYLIVA